LTQSLATVKDSLQQKTLLLHKHEEAKEIIRAVGMLTQQSLTVNISDITSLALEAIFADPYILKCDFLQRRNKTECDLYFERDGNRLDPIEASGIGAVDVASFALRIASWSMMQPHTRNVIVLDEPFKFLSKNLHEQASEMLKELSKKLNLQFILVSHEAIIASSADRTFTVTNRNGISRVTSN
jgi:DNA repair exonuclease SbcCD ATPase subunit